MDSVEGVKAAGAHLLPFAVFAFFLRAGFKASSSSSSTMNPSRESSSSYLPARFLPAAALPFYVLALPFLPACPFTAYFRSPAPGPSASPLITGLIISKLSTFFSCLLA